MTTFTTTPPPDDQLTLLVWFIVRFRPDATNKDPALQRGTIFPVPGSYLGGYMSKSGWEWMRLDEFWQGAEVANGDGKVANMRQYAQWALGHVEEAIHQASLTKDYIKEALK